MERRNAATEAAALACLMQSLSEQLTLSPARMQELRDMADEARQFARRLTDFETQFAPLDLVVDDDRTHATMMEWQALEGGKHAAGSTEFDRVVGASRALRPLHRAGLDLTSVYKFSGPELALAHAIGEGFEDWAEPWDRLKLLVHRHGSNHDLYLKFDHEHHELYSRFMHAMATVGFLGDLRLERYVYSKEQWIPLNERKIRYMTSNPRLRYRFRVATPELLGILTGLWFNAFAFDVVHDHLSRNEIDHELFTNVVYHSPRDLVHDDGDFDVLGRFMDKILLIECKSGRLQGKHEVLDDVIAKSDGVRRVFELSGEPDELVSVLLYNPHLNDPAKVRERLDGTGLIAVKPDELRSLITGLCGPDRLVTVPVG